MTAWALIPGSDTPGDRVEPLVKIGSENGYDYYVGLVDIAVASIVPAIPGTNDGWTIFAADSAWTIAGVDNSSIQVGGGNPVSPGRYGVVWYDSSGTGPRPLPAGWLPVEGPKFLGVSEDGSYAYWGGRVHADGLTPVPVAGVSFTWSLVPVDTPLTFAALDMASASFHPGETPTAGDYVAQFATSAVVVPPPSWPTGWTPLTSVCGPIAITDENAGAVIDDIAYVVSGFAYNVNTIAAVQLGYRDRGAWSDEESYSVDDVVLYQGNKAWHCIADATAGTEQPNANPTSWERLPVPSVWPYLERFDLTTQKWLPRIKLPEIAPAAPAFLGARHAMVWTTGPTQYEAWAYEVVSEVSGLVPDEYDTLAALESVGYDYHLTPGNGTGAVGDYAVFTWNKDEQPDPPTYGSFTPFAKSSYAAEGGFAGAINGKLYFGGGDGDNITGSELFSYDPTSQTFERLDDAPTHTGWPSADYSPFGTVSGKLHLFRMLSATPGDNSSLQHLAYDPVAGTWSASDLTSAESNDSGTVGDQIAGVELGGKLYFVYDRVYVFDPVALTVEAKAAVPTGSSSCAWTDGSGLHLVDGGDPRAQFVYDVGADTWTAETVTGMPIAGYAVTLHGSSGTYVLSGLYDHFNGSNVRGVYALLGSSYVAQAFTHLTHLGFSPRQAALLQADPGTASVKTLIRSGFSPRQAKTLKRGDRSLKALIRGGFDRHQAKVLEA